MKPIIILLSTFFFGLVAFSQDPLTHEKVIQADSLKTDQIFMGISEWFSSFYKSANDVVQMSDKEAGVILGKGSFEYKTSLNPINYSCYNGFVTYSIKVQIREGRFKLKLTDFVHSQKAGNASQCKLGLITTDELYTEKGMAKKFHNNSWKDIKTNCESKFNEIVSSLEVKVSKLVSDASNDDW